MLFQQIAWILAIYIPMIPISAFDADNISETQVLTIYSNTRPLTMKSKPQINLEWPKGAYGILSPKEGCPDTLRTKWDIGWLFQNTENNQNENNSSKNLGSKVHVTKNGITQHFCMKRDPTGTYPWPHGTYCVYQYGKNCPKNFHSGFIFWDDENDKNKNSHNGYLPQGSYSFDTEIRFCCRYDGDLEKEIELPALRPFILFPTNFPICQKVKNMKSRLEYIKFDDEDDDNKNTQGGAYPYGVQPSKQDHYLYYCYYKCKIAPKPVIEAPKIANPVVFINKTNNTNIKLLVNYKSDVLLNRRRVIVFLAVLFVTLILGTTTILTVKQFVSLGYDHFNIFKDLHIGERFAELGRTIRKKYDDIRAPISDYNLFEDIQNFVIDEPQELAEDCFVPKNSELQHSLTLLFMKNQQKRLASKN